MANGSDEQSWWGFRNRTVWEWLHLIGVVALPFVILIVGCSLNTRQAARQDESDNQRAKDDQNIEEQRAQADALQAYLDQMSTLLLYEGLGDPVGPDNPEARSEKVQTLARARTLTVLERLGLPEREGEEVDSPESGGEVVDSTERESEVIRFLVQARLVQGEAPIVDLDRADLKGVNLYFADLTEIELSDTYLTEADLSTAELRGADLSNSDLTGAKLRGANLACTDRADAEPYVLGAPSCTDLSLANLKGANLSCVALRNPNQPCADLIEDNLDCGNRIPGELYCTDLTNVNLAGAGLTGADLSRADLTGADGMTNCELDHQAKFLEGATMPNGQKYEDWRKDRECNEEENNDSS